MGMYNLLDLVLECPRCGLIGAAEAEFRFGFRNLDRYVLGDRLRWTDDPETTRGRPTDGNFTGEGYVECSVCRRDFWIDIEVRHDRLVAATIDRNKPGYITEA